MDKISKVIVYIDNLLINSQIHEQTIGNARCINAKIGRKSYENQAQQMFFGNTEVSYLGIRLTPSEFKPEKN